MIARKSRWLTILSHQPNLASEPKKLYKPERSSAPDSHAAFFRLRFLHACEKIPVMSGVGEYKTRKGNMSGPSLVGFLAPDTHNECPKKAARGKGNA